MQMQIDMHRLKHVVPRETATKNNMFEEDHAFVNMFINYVQKLSFSKNALSDFSQTPHLLNDVHRQPRVCVSNFTTYVQQACA